jgi:hypothetical protein
LPLLGRHQRAAKVGTGAWQLDTLWLSEAILH